MSGHNKYWNAYLYLHDSQTNRLNIILFCKITERADGYFTILLSPMYIAILEESYYHMSLCRLLFVYLLPPSIRLCNHLDCIQHDLLFFVCYLFIHIFRYCPFDFYSYLANADGVQGDNLQTNLPNSRGCNTYRTRWNGLTPMHYSRLVAFYGSRIKSFGMIIG